MTLDLLLNHRVQKTNCTQHTDYFSIVEMKRTNSVLIACLTSNIVSRDDVREGAMH